MRRYRSYRRRPSRRQVIRRIRSLKRMLGRNRRRRSYTRSRPVVRRIGYRM